jgi:hypothetical protein
MKDSSLSVKSFIIPDEMGGFEEIDFKDKMQGMGRKSYMPVSLRRKVSLESLDSEESMQKSDSKIPLRRLSRITSTCPSHNPLHNLY